MKLPNSQLTFRTTDREAKLTLAAAVRGWIDGCSWNAAKTLITNRRIQVNGNLCVDEARRLKIDDVIRVTEHSQPKPVSAKRVKVAYLDEHLVVFEKPVGVTSVRHFEERKMHVKRRQLQPTLQELAPEAIARQMYDLRHAGEGNALRRRRDRSSAEIEALIANAARHHAVLAVHRLDRDTSGLIMFARTQAAAMALSKMFKKHEIDRRYTAVVQGDCKPQTLVSYMLRDRGDGRRGSAIIENGMIPSDARRAVTHVRPVQSLADARYTVVECKLETGRTHQIRIHLSEAGHPICGEKIYVRSLLGEQIRDESKAPRQALHAGRLKFVHPMTGQKISLKMDLPFDLQNWIEGFSKLR